MTDGRIIRVAMGSVAVGIFVLGLKYAAYMMTGSVALLSDALESIVNVVTAIAALVAVRLAARPASEAMPYGYHKAEYFSAVVEGVFIVGAAVLIFREAWLGFVAGTMPEYSPAGLAVNGLATVINIVWANVLLRTARAHRSPALKADGKHLLTDVVSSVGVLLGVILAYATGWAVLDPLLAALVGLNILWSGYRLIGESVGGLMDVAVDEDTLKSIRGQISQHAEGAIEAHDVRTRQAGRMTYIDFHLVVPGQMSVDEAHSICDRIEEGLRAEIEGAAVTIHVEPEEKAKHSGVVVL